MKKKFVVFTLALSMAYMTVVGCGMGDNNNNSVTSGEQDSTVEPTITPSPTEDTGTGTNDDTNTDTNTDMNTNTNTDVNGTLEEPGNTPDGAGTTNDTNTSMDQTEPDTGAKNSKVRNKNDNSVMDDIGTGVKDAVDGVGNGVKDAVDGVERAVDDVVR